MCKWDWPLGNGPGLLIEKSSDQGEGHGQKREWVACRLVQVQYDWLSLSGWGGNVCQSYQMTTCSFNEEDDWDGYKGNSERWRQTKKMMAKFVWRKEWTTPQSQSQATTPHGLHLVSHLAEEEEELRISTRLFLSPSQRFSTCNFVEWGIVLWCTWFDGWGRRIRNIHNLIVLVDTVLFNL